MAKYIVVWDSWCSILYCPRGTKPMDDQWTRHRIDAARLSLRQAQCIASQMGAYENTVAITKVEE